MASQMASPASAANDPSITPVDVVIDTIEIVSEGDSPPPQLSPPRAIGFSDYQSLRAYEWEG
jgi:hypothetical protein